MFFNRAQCLFFRFGGCRSLGDLSDGRNPVGPLRSSPTGEMMMLLEIAWIQVWLSVKRNIRLNRCHHYHRLYCNATTIKIQKLKSRLRRFELFFSIEQRKAWFCKLNGKKIEKVIFVLNFRVDSFLFHSPPHFWFQSLYAIGGSAFILNAENSISYFMTILSRPSSLFLRYTTFLLSPTLIQMRLRWKNFSKKKTL